MAPHGWLVAAGLERRQLLFVLVHDVQRRNNEKSTSTVAHAPALCSASGAYAYMYGDQCYRRLFCITVDLRAMTTMPVTHSSPLPWWNCCQGDRLARLQLDRLTTGARYIDLSLRYRCTQVRDAIPY